MSYLHLLPLHAGEVVLERSAPVTEPIPLLDRQIAAPMANLNIALQQRCVQKRLSEVIAHGDDLLSASGYFGVRAVVIAHTLLLRVLVTVGVGADDGVVWHIGGRQLQLGLLLQSHIGGGRIGAEGVLDVLLLGLGDAGWKRLESGQGMERNGKGHLLGRCEGSVEV